MVKGLYTAYTGMVNSQYRMDILSNNLANSTTTGYKAEGCTTQAFDTMYAIKVKDRSVYNINQNIGNLSLGAKIGETYTDWSQGSFKATADNYNVALGGDGFFNIEYTDKQGNTSTMYTRDGEFHMNVDGYLLTKDGDYVLGQGGNRIQIPTDVSKFAVDSQGNIYADGMYVDTFEVTDFEDYNYIEKFGENLVRTVDGAVEKDSTATVNQGYLEASNINVVEEMVNMIAVAREYEGGQKIIQTVDEMLGKMVSISEV